MLTLFDDLISGNGYKVRLTLSELGISFRYRHVQIMRGETRAEWFLEKNPVGQVPVLELDDGTCLCESTAILMYLARGTELLPAAVLDQTRVLQWMCFEQSNIDGVISRARFRRRFPDVIPTRPEEFTTWAEDGTRALEVLEQHLSHSQFMVGEQFTVADIAIYAYVHCAPEGGFDLGGFPAIGDWLQRVSRRPRHVSMECVPASLTDTA